MRTFHLEHSPWCAEEGTWILFQVAGFTNYREQLRGK